MARQDLLRLAKGAAAVIALAALCASPAFAGSSDQSAAGTTTTVTASSGPAGSAEVAQGNPFSDVPPNSWAYQAIKSLAAEGLIEGYPDGKFKGNRPLTRYEAAVLVNRAVDKIEARLSSVEGAEKVNADDIAKLKKLVADFGPELKAVQDHLATLDTKVEALGKETAANTATLKRQQFHLYSFFRAPGDFRDSTEAYNGPVAQSTANGMIGNIPAGGGLPPGTKIISGDSLGSPGGVAPQNVNFTGQNTYGTAYEVTRMIFSGDVDPNVSYYIRLENRYYLEGPNNGTPIFTTGNSFINPNYCTSLASCNPNADYPANGAFRINIAALTWHTPGGFAITAGRILPLEALPGDLGGQLLGLSYADYFNGAQLGYTHKLGDSLLRIEGGYGFGNPAAQAPGGLISQQQLWAHGDYDFIPHHLNLGAAWITEIGNNEVLWDPSAPLFYTSGPLKGTQIAGVSGAYCGISTTPASTVNGGAGCPAFFGTPMTYGSIYGTYRFNDYLHVQAEFGHHFGNDPFTGSTWQQPNAVWAVATIGNNAGPKGTGWAEVGFIGSGFNGVSPETDITGTTFYSQLYIGNPAGYQIWYGGLHWHVADNAEIALIGEHFQLLPGIDIPAGSATCPGCFIAQDKKDAVFLQSLIAF